MPKKKIASWIPGTEPGTFIPMNRKARQQFKRSEGFRPRPQLTPLRKTKETETEIHYDREEYKRGI